MQQHSFKRILIIATRQIGDTLITTPLIQRAKEIWPEAQIDFLGFAHAKDILHGNPYLHQIIGTSQKPTLQEYLKILQKIFFGVPTGNMQRQPIATKAKPIPRTRAKRLV